MKHLIVLLALVALSKAFFINQLIKTYTNPTVKPTIVVKPEVPPITTYKVNQYTTYQAKPLVTKIAPTDLVYNPLFQSVIRQAISQGASINLQHLPDSDYEKLIHIMRFSPNQISVPLYIPPVNILPLEQDPKFYRPINVLPSKSGETSISTSESDVLPSQTVDESSKVQGSTPEINSTTAENTESKKINEANKNESNELDQINELPSQNEAVEFNNNEKVNSLAGDEDFSHSYTLKDGTKVAEKGYITKNEDGSEILAKQGNYEWVDANGKLIKVNWIADENGFRVLE